MVNELTPLITTVDDLQVVDLSLPMEPHDWPLDWVITPEKAIATTTAYPKPTGLDWSVIQDDQWETIPILKQLKKIEDDFKFSIRKARESDASQMLLGVNRVIGEQKYLGSAEPFSSEAQNSYLKEVFEKHYPMMVSELNQTIIGVCDIIPYPELGFRHVGKLGMWVLPEYRGKGVGRELLVHTLSEAKKFGLEKVELQVYSDNQPAISLYKSVGFVQEGERTKVRKLNSIYQNLMNMGLFL